MSPDMRVHRWLRFQKNDVAVFSFSSTGKPVLRRWRVAGDHGYSKPNAVVRGDLIPGGGYRVSGDVLYEIFPE